MAQRENGQPSFFAQSGRMSGDSGEGIRELTKGRVGRDIALRNSGVTTQQGNIRSFLGSVSAKLNWRLRNVRAGLVRRWNDLRGLDHASTASSRTDSAREIY